MKNITLSADERLIKQAREQARTRKTTLNQLFRHWLEEVAAVRERGQRVDTLFKRLDQVNAGGKFSREEMNER